MIECRTEYAFRCIAVRRAQERPLGVSMHHEQGSPQENKVGEKAINIEANSWYLVVSMVNAVHNMPTRWQNTTIVINKVSSQKKMPGSNDALIRWAIHTDITLQRVYILAEIAKDRSCRGA